MRESEQDDFRAVLDRDPAEGWRRFIDRYTPMLLAALERAGVTDQDEAMEIYVLVCERLAANQCAALRRWDPGRGSIESWLTVVVRRAAVDWIRSRAGRKRLFGVVTRLPRFEQRVFELYYWRGVMPAELAQQLSAQERRDVTLAEVFDALASIDAVLTERHRSDLLSLAARSRPAALDDQTEAEHPAAADPDPEQGLQLRQLEERLRAALSALPEEEAAIFSLRYEEGLSVREIQRLLRLEKLSATRVAEIASRVRAAL